MSYSVSWGTKDAVGFRLVYVFIYLSLPLWYPSFSYQTVKLDLIPITSQILGSVKKLGTTAELFIISGLNLDTLRITQG